METSMELTENDKMLIDMARDIIHKNQDDVKYYHTVGCALRCKNGRVYLGVNCDGIHGSCAEYIAIGAAITAGEREFDCIVAVWGKTGAIIPPCGNCRQMLHDYTGTINIIVQGAEGPEKHSIKELLPYPYIEKL